MGADARRLPAPIRQPSRHIKLDLSANTSIRQLQPKGKIDLTFFVFYNCLRSAPPISQSSAAEGSMRAASAMAAKAATSGSASRAGSSHICHVDRATPASFAACAWLRLQSLRQCFKPILSHPPAAEKRPCRVHGSTPPLKKSLHNLSPTRRRRQKRPFCHLSRRYVLPCRAYPFAAHPSKPCKNQRCVAPISAAAARKGASLAFYPASLPFSRAYTRARALPLGR